MNQIIDLNHVKTRHLEFTKPFGDKGSGEIISNDEIHFVGRGFGNSFNDHDIRYFTGESFIIFENCNGKMVKPTKKIEDTSSGHPMFQLNFTFDRIKVQEKISGINS